MTANKPAPSKTMISPNVATYQIVGRSRRRTRRWRPSRDEVASIAKAIPGSAHSLDQLDGKFVVDLAAQAPHQHLEHVGEWIMILVPHVSRDGCAVNDLAVMEHEELEQRELLGGELDRLPGATNALRLKINLQIRNAQRFRQRCSTPACERSDARQQLAERERFGQIVVGTYLEARDAVVNGVSRGEHQNRCRHFPRTQLPTKIEAAATRQHDVEYDDIERAEQRFHLAVGVVGDGYDLDSVLGKPCLNDRGQPGIVLDQKNSHCRQFTCLDLGRTPCNQDDSYAL